MTNSNLDKQSIFGERASSLKIKGQVPFKGETMKKYWNFAGIFQKSSQSQIG